MPLWVSMKCVKSQNQLLFHTMIKLYRQFQLGIVCADVWYRWFNYLNLTNSDLFQTYTKLDRSNVHQTNAKLTHWPNSKKIAKMWPNLRPTNFFILGLLYSWKINIFVFVFSYLYFFASDLIVFVSCIWICICNFGYMLC